ncbi:MAG: hypothetical protein QOF48_3328, partial [Verrucomicrobiota bacterium]
AQFPGSSCAFGPSYPLSFSFFYWSDKYGVMASFRRPRELRQSAVAAAWRDLPAAMVVWPSLGEARRAFLTTVATPGHASPWRSAEGPRHDGKGLSMPLQQTAGALQDQSCAGRAWEVAGADRIQIAANTPRPAFPAGFQFMTTRLTRCLNLNRPTSSKLKATIHPDAAAQINQTWRG